LNFSNIGKSIKVRFNISLSELFIPNKVKSDVQLGRYKANEKVRSAQMAKETIWAGLTILVDGILIDP